MRHPYSAADPMSLEWAWLIRLLVLVLVLVLASAAVLVLCMLRLMPRRRLPLITTLGAGGFTIYLLHPLVILPFRELGWTARVNTPVEIVGPVLCAILLTMVLGSPAVRLLVSPLTRPPTDWLFAPPPPAPSSNGTGPPSTYHRHGWHRPYRIRSLCLRRSPCVLVPRSPCVRRNPPRQDGLLVTPPARCAPAGRGAARRR